MGQILQTTMYDRSTEDAVEALKLAGTPLLWTHLDDGVMGGKSITNLSSTNGCLQFSGTIDTNASVGWASARARLPELSESSQGLKITAQGDGKTYKVILMHANHDNRFVEKSPLWEANLPTKKDTVETTMLPWNTFMPSFMARQLTDDEKAKHKLKPASLTKMGFMLSSRLSDGSLNPVATYGEGTFPFSLRVDAIETVVGDKQQ